MSDFKPKPMAVPEIDQLRIQIQEATAWVESVEYDSDLEMPTTDALDYLRLEAQALARSIETLFRP